MLALYYYLFTLALILLLIFGFNYYAKKAELQNKNLQLKKLVGGLFLWGIYLCVLSYSGILKNFDIPPKLPLFIIIPAFTIIILLLIKNKRNKIINPIPPHIPILFESFRIPVELLLHGTFLAGLIPIQTTFSGYNFEIYFAASAIVMSFLVYKRVIYKPIILLWNIVGLVFLGIILSIFVTTAFFPSVWGENESLVSSDFGTLPYLIVPAFYVPLAIFMHGISIIQATKN